MGPPAARRVDRSALDQRAASDPHQGVLALDAGPSVEHLLADVPHEVIELALDTRHLLAHVQDDFHPGEVDAEIAGESEDRLQTAQRLLVVQAGVALRARRPDQALALVHAQGLRVDVVALGDDADQHRAGGTPATGHQRPSRTSTRRAPEDGPRLPTLIDRMPRS